MKLMGFSSGLSVFLTTAFVAHSAPSFRAVEIDNKIEIGYGVAVADVGVHRVA